jgi:hypothetical protein
MHPKAEAFLNELRAAPKFQTAPASDPVWLEHVDEIEFVFRRLYEEGVERTEAMAILDDVLAIISARATASKQGCSNWLSCWPRKSPRSTHGAESDCMWDRGHRGVTAGASRSSLTGLISTCSQGRRFNFPGLIATRFCQTSCYIGALTMRLPESRGASVRP